MRSVVFLAAVALLGGCADDDDDDVDFTMSSFVGGYVGSCEQTKDGDPEYLARGTIQFSVGRVGETSGTFTFVPNDDTAIVALRGTVADDGQFAGEEQASRQRAVPCDGTMSLTGDGVDGELVKRDGDPAATYRLWFSTTRK